MAGCWHLARLVISIAFLPNGQLLILEGHTSLILSVAFSPNGWLLASGLYNKTIQLWDPATGALKEILSTDSPVMVVKFSQDSSYLLTNLGLFKIQFSRGQSIAKLFSCSAARANILALGHLSDRVSFFEFRK
ncbi:WD40 repeat domain-containing protein [Aspergillus lucknowensis]|uniref:WD40 repeat-like protein n=1 Tax=Aspergillus lucknowensis TaxID=176173 RepID=A0ABR4LI46_9EURO